MNLRHIVLVLALSGLLGCSPAQRAVDLTRSPEALSEASMAGRARSWVVDQMGREMRLSDVQRRTLLASPPSRLLFNLDVPRGARLAFACGVDPTRHDRPGIEFTVKIRRGAREDRIWSRLMDPLRRPADRRWVEADIDLSPHAGRGVGIVFETRGYEEIDDPTVAYWGSPVLTVTRPAPLVVLYLVDTLRADHTSLAGYERDTTPRLAAFARDAVVFDQAVAQASWTRPSVASILTSLAPHQHRAIQLRDALDPERQTLAELLQAKGFATGAILSNVVIYGKDTRFDQGFDFFAGLHGPNDRPSKSVPAAQVVDAAVGWIDAHRGQPGFLFVHTMDPHVPYTPPAPYDRLYEPHPAPGHPGVDPRSDYLEPLDQLRLIAQYDGEIAYGDREFGRFVDALQSRGLYEDAIIVFVADHGEEFLDHGQWLHGRSVFDELIRVPLVVKLPGRRHAGRHVVQQVQTVDILPTVLAALDLPVPKAPAIAGRPLQDAIAGSAGPLPAVSEISHRGYVAFGVRTEKDKYVRRFSPAVDPVFGPESELYFDLVRDPRETANRLARAGARAAELKPAADPAMIASPFRPTLRIVGGSGYRLTLRTPGWIESLDASGLDPGDRVEQKETHGLDLDLRPRAGGPREISFAVRPVGAPVVLAGTRDGRALRTTDVLVGEVGTPAAAVPVPLPTGDPDSEDEPGANVFAPPRGQRPGLHLWLAPSAEHRVVGPLDPETCEQMRVLGYVEQCG